MKANELMIGDLVLCDGKVMEVGALSTYDIQADLFIEDELAEQIWAEDMDSINGIPLTKEIMKNNGYNLCNGEGFLFCLDKEKELFIDVLDGEIGNYFRNIAGDYEWHLISNCRYVHQLQHAFRIFGIEKGIEL